MIGVTSSLFCYFDSTGYQTSGFCGVLTALPRAGERIESFLLTSSHPTYFIGNLIMFMITVGWAFFLFLSLLSFIFSNVSQKFGLRVAIYISFAAALLVLVGNLIM
jgi:hypothetical protein